MSDSNRAGGGNKSSPTRMRIGSWGCITLSFCAAIAQAGPSTGITQIRVARSEDGWHFDDQGVVFADRATAPDLLLVDEGRWLAVFDRSVGDDPLQTRLMMAESHDEGRSWSTARRVRIAGIDSRVWHVRHGALTKSRDGSLRLLFTAKRREDRRRGGRSSRERSRLGGVLILSAVSTKGEFFRLDPRTRIRLERVADAYPSAVWLGDQLHVYAAVASGEETQREAASAPEWLSRAAHLLSRDGHTFGRVTEVMSDGASMRGAMIVRDRQLTGFVGSREGIVTISSRDGRFWKRKGEVGLAGGWDPAVARLADGSWLMLYCAKSDPRGEDQRVVEQVTVDAGSLDEAEDPEADGVGEQDVVAINPADEGGEGSEVVEIVGADTNGGDAGGDTVVTLEEDQESAKKNEINSGDPPATRADGSRPSNGGAVDRAGWDEPPALSLWEHIDPNGFAPRPDFMHKTDYIEWYRRFALKDSDDNAYYAYGEFMPVSGRTDGLPLPWPDEFHSFYDDDYLGAPGPWDPSDHPEWETSNREWAPLVDRFAEAAKHADYSIPPDKLQVSTGDLPNGDELLLGIMLPSLQPHRQLAKATLSDAWRKENGKVDPLRMLKAWRTVLRGADHMGQGATLIEDLVAAAERNLVHETARRALAHDVFSENELREALDTLHELDHDDHDPATLVRGEHAFAMDITQYLFTPLSPDGRPQINLERAGAILPALGDDSFSLDDFKSLQAHDAYATLDAFDAHYREFVELMRIGYPAVRAVDMESLTDKRLHTNVLTQMFMPSLSRYYLLKTRSETSRRATQLSYAVHLFKARNGRWPASLDELPDSPNERMRFRMRFDPFSGESFGYRVDENGARIWSASENGLDDGGVHTRRWNDEPDLETGSDDFVFWPVQAK